MCQDRSHASHILETCSHRVVDDEGLLLRYAKIWSISRKWPRRGLARCEDIKNTSKYISNCPNSTAYPRVPAHSWHNIGSLSSNLGVMSNSGEFLLLKGAFAVVGSSNSLFEITSFTVFSAVLTYFWVLGPHWPPIYALEFHLTIEVDFWRRVGIILKYNIWLM